MKLRMDPVSAIALSILLGWAWYTATDEGPTCLVQEVHDSKTMYVPYLCSEVIN